MPQIRPNMCQVEIGGSYVSACDGLLCPMDVSGIPGKCDIRKVRKMLLLVAVHFSYDVIWGKAYDVPDHHA